MSHKESYKCPEERPDGNPVVAPVQVDPVAGGNALWIKLDHPAERTATTAQP
uniref:Uncharacterized protein n=1 Tax=Streptomyces sp. NBC_01393 TaxID=2903851 RepID=A0AAU3I8Q9_9ACTN